MIAAVGLSLGGLEVNIAIILVHYAVLFLCVLPFLGLDVKHLLVLAAGWVLVSPALAFLLRPWLLAAEPPLQLGHNPMWEDLSTPAVLLGDLFLTGYYPVLQWIAYLLVGLAIGRLALTSAAVPVLLLAVGSAAAVLAKWLSVVMMEDWGGRAALQASLLRSLVPAGEPPAGQSGRRGADRFRVVARHQRPALGHHPGPAAHLGGGGRRRRRLPAAGPAGPVAGLDLLLPLRGAGAMTLSLYTAHLCVMASLYGQPLPSGWTLRASTGRRPRRSWSWAALRGPVVAGAAGVGGACGQPAGPATSRPASASCPGAGTRPRIRPGGIPCGTAGRRRASRRGPACGRPRRHRRS